MTVYRVEFTGWNDFDDCWRECQALSAAEFMLARIPAGNLPARIVDRDTRDVIAIREKVPA